MAMIDHRPMEQKFRKTKFCSFLRKGRCGRGEACSYAHSEAELERLPDFSKTTICQQWKDGKCPYAMDKCRFAHGKQDLRTQHSKQEPPTQPPATSQDLCKELRNDYIAGFAYGYSAASPKLGGEPVKIQVSKPTVVFEAPDLVPCSFRRPKVGDQVQSSVGDVTLEDARGNEGAWKLPAGEIAIVSSVDEDGDFRLLTKGLESCVTYRKDYAYVRKSSPWSGSWEMGWMPSPWAGGYDAWGTQLGLSQLGGLPLTKPTRSETLLKPSDPLRKESESTESTEPGSSSGNTSDDDDSTVTPPPGLSTPPGLLHGLSPHIFLPPGLPPPPGLQGL